MEFVGQSVFPVEFDRAGADHSDALLLANGVINHDPDNFSRNDLMEKKEQVGFELQLLELRKRLLREVDTAEDALREDVDKPGEISSVPTHPADQDVEGLDAEIAIAQNEELLLEQVEVVLERIGAGTYGICQQCGRTIDARLQAIPYASRCIDWPVANRTRSKNRYAVNRDASGELATFADRRSGCAARSKCRGQNQPAVFPAARPLSGIRLKHS